MFSGNLAGLAVKSFNLTGVQSGTTPPPPPSLADRASRFGSPQDGPPRPSLPMPSGNPVPGLGDPVADREVNKREQPGRTGLIDPDEPTEGIRML